MSEARPRAGKQVPVPLVIGFGVFLAAMAYLVASSFTRRTAPTFAAAVEARGDTLTVDATDADRWRYVSLRHGRVLSPPDTHGWDIAVRRYNVIANGDAIDLGLAAFESVRSATFAPELNLPAIGRWYRYSLLTHLLESNRHVYAVRGPGGSAFKFRILSYYCPGLTAGCMTLQFAPLEGARASSMH